MGDEQAAVIGQDAQVVDGADAFVRPDEVAVPIVFDDGFIDAGIYQMAVRQQAAALIKRRGHLPGVDDIAVHVDKADVIGKGIDGGRPNLVVLMIADGAVIGDEDITAVGLIGFIDGGAGGKHRLR